tara:strand:- start:1048 stop:1227 length:180 start_codon:yes stop_codon:yes gene_type:complete
MSLLKHQAYVKLPDWAWPIVVDVLSKDEKKGTVKISYYCDLHERRREETIPSSWILKQS